MLALKTAALWLKCLLTSVLGKRRWVQMGVPECVCGLFRVGVKELLVVRMLLCLLRIYVGSGVLSTVPLVVTLLVT